MPKPLEQLPGFLIRRLQQIAVAVFLEETQASGITPVQYAALATVQGTPELDQRRLAARIGFDTSTIGSVIDRLEARGLVRRTPNPNDRRARLLTLTLEGQQVLAEVTPAMLRAQQRMLAPLSAAERKQFMALLGTLVESNNALSRAPSAMPVDE